MQFLLLQNRLLLNKMLKIQRFASNNAVMYSSVLIITCNIWFHKKIIICELSIVLILYLSINKWNSNPVIQYQWTTVSTETINLLVTTEQVLSSSTTSHHITLQQYIDTFYLRLTIPQADNYTHIHMHTHTTILRLYGFCPGQPGWADTRKNIHPFTPIMVINRPLSASSI